MHLASLSSPDLSNRLACNAMASSGLSVWQPVDRACSGWIAEEGEREWGKQMNKTLWFCAVLTSVNTTLFTHKSSVNRWGEWHTFTQKHKDVEHETDMLMFSFQHTINGLTHRVPLSWPIYRPSSVLIWACKLEPMRRGLSGTHDCLNLHSSYLNKKLEVSPSKIRTRSPTVLIKKTF